MTFDPPDAAAYHEAGHVLAAHLLGGEVREATLESEREDHEGHTAVRWRGLGEEEHLRCSALVALAGPLAETLWRGLDWQNDDLRTWRADEAEVEAALAALVSAPERDAARARWVAEVAARLRDPEAWEHLCRIADALHAHETLDAALLADLLP